MSKRFYRPELDVVRFVAFIAVFCNHSLRERPISTVSGAAVDAGAFGVQLFFTLSAYLITSLLLRERETTATVDLPKFYKRRALRIWPLYFGALLVSAIGSLAHGTFGQTGIWYLAALFMLGNVVRGSVTSVIHLWSISLEEQFYLFWPAVMRYGSRRVLVSVAVLLIVIANCFLWYYGAIHADTYIRVFWNTFVEMEFFAAGILLALLNERWTPKAIPIAVRIVGILCCPCLVLTVTYMFRLRADGVNAMNSLALCVGYALVAVACVALILLMPQTSRWPKAVIFGGKISFGLYVFHLPVIKLVQHTLHNAVEPIQLAVIFFITYVLASLSYRYFETPFLQLKERFEVVKSRPVS